MKKSKNKKKLLESVDLTKIYEPLEAIKILKDNSYVKFQETLDVSINLGIDIFAKAWQRHADEDEAIRGTTDPRLEQIEELFHICE